MLARASLAGAFVVALCALASASPLGSLCTPVQRSAGDVVGAAPIVTIAKSDSLAQPWDPGRCTGLAAHGTRLAITVSGRVAFDGNLDQLLARLAAVSSLTRVRYWSATSSEWRPVAYAASALSGPDPTQRRGDFRTAELLPGSVLYYWEDDSRSGEIVMRLRVREHEARRIVLTTDNVSDVSSYMMTVFPAGSLESLIMIERTDPHTVRITLMSRALDESSSLVRLHVSSLTNRAVALFRLIAGIPTDSAPPPEPRVAGDPD